MAKNNRPHTTLTRSISFDKVVDQMEKRRKALRLNRSTFLCYVLEHQLGMVDRAFLALNPTTVPSKEAPTKS